MSYRFSSQNFIAQNQNPVSSTNGTTTVQWRTPSEKAKAMAIMPRVPTIQRTAGA